MTLHRRQLEAALRAVTILSPTRFAWFERVSPSLPRKTLRALDAEAARAYLVSQLRQRLYTGFYSVGLPTPDAPSNRALRCPDFVHALSSANAGKGAWTAGWLVRSLEDGSIVGEREELRLRAPPGSFREPAAGAVRVGGMVELRMPKEQLGISPGHYLARSDVDRDTGFEATLVRVYWNATAAGALGLMACLTETLNALGLFFRFKVIAHPEGFTRCDSAVLYLRADDFERAGPAIARGYTAAARELGPAVPAFTKRLADGVSVAEDPAESGSFGWHRCGLVAEAIVGAHERGIHTLEERVESVARRFAAAGLNFDAPHLNPGSHDRYRLVLGTRASGARAERRDGDGAPAAERALALSTRIGERLAAAALWHEGRCTWLGPAHCPAPCAGTAPLDANERRTLGPSLYDGTSGVGLFLAELAAVTKLGVFETAAVGAARQSLARFGNHPASRNLGLYVGWPGVALAVARIGELTGDASLVDGARALVAANASRAHDARAFDVISGSAGGILALLSLGGSLGENRCVRIAERLGDSLCESAERSPSGLSWRAPEQRRGANLTGYSHGTAGVAHALLELFAATRNDRYLSSARQAFDYERHCFAPAEGNWPDFRIQHQVSVKRTAPPLFRTAWCHGAPGIALSRLALSRLCARDRFEDTAGPAELASALEATARAIERDLESGTAVASLCHGITGNVEILTYACDVGRDRTGRLSESVRRATAWVLTHAHGTLKSEEKKPAHPADPGLMLGAAGLGHFLLRVARPATPSALWAAAKA